MNSKNLKKIIFVSTLLGCVIASDAKAVRKNTLEAKVRKLQQIVNRLKERVGDEMEGDNNYGHNYSISKLDCPYEEKPDGKVSLTNLWNYVVGRNNTIGLGDMLLNKIDNTHNKSASFYGLGALKITKNSNDPSDAYRVNETGNMIFNNVTALGKLSMSGPISFDGGLTVTGKFTAGNGKFVVDGTASDSSIMTIEDGNKAKVLSIDSGGTITTKGGIKKTDSSGENLFSIDSNTGNITAEASAFFKDNDKIMFSIDNASGAVNMPSAYLTCGFITSSGPISAPSIIGNIGKFGQLQGDTLTSNLLSVGNSTAGGGMPFQVDGNGKLTANGATINGDLSTENMSFNNKLWCKSLEVGDPASPSNEAPFKVDSAGKLTTSGTLTTSGGANITGTGSLSVGTGSITPFKVESTGALTTSGILTTSGGVKIIGGGLLAVGASDNTSSAPFQVNDDGKLTASGGADKTALKDMLNGHNLSLTNTAIFSSANGSTNTLKVTDVLTAKKYEITGDESDE